MLPPEYAASEDGHELDAELLSRWYDLEPLQSGAAVFIDPKRAVGVYIDHTAANEDGSVRTQAYHRFSDAERAMIVSTREGTGVISFGRKPPEGTTTYGRRIELQSGDMLNGMAQSISVQHLQFGGRDGRSVVRDSSTFHGATIVYERPIGRRATPYMHEQFPKRTVDVQSLSVGGPTMRNEVARLVTAALSGRDLPHDVVEFNAIVDEGEGHTQFTRDQLHHVLKALRHHELHGGSDRLQEQSEGRRKRLVRGIETALNPMMQSAQVSSERKRSWREMARAQSPEEIERLLTNYRANVSTLERQWGQWDEMQNVQAMTGDNRLRETYRQLVSTAFVDPNEERMRYDQFFEAYYHWLQDAVQTLESLSTAG